MRSSRRTGHKPVGWQMVAAVAAVALVVAAGAGGAGEAGGEAGKKTSGEWTQWGGPGQSFKVHDVGLTAWSEAGPRRLWKRELGEGYSGVLAAGGRLYTMHRTGGMEAVIALDAATGETVWEHRYDSEPHESHTHQFGDGPRATPLIAGDRLYAIGVAGKMHCLDKKTGKVHWSHELWGETFGGTVLNFGYSSSPIAHEGSVIVLVGGEEAGVVALDGTTGEVRWKTGGFENSYSSPRLMEIGGTTQLVTFMATEIIGLDPATGKLLWQHPQSNQFKQNINMPVVADGRYVFLSSPEAGAKGLKLTPGDGGIEVEEVWSTRKIQFYHVSSVQDGEWVYGSTGTRAPAFLAAVNIKTGDIAWRERGIAKANVIGVDGKLVILDEDGVLYLASADPEGFEVLAKTELFDEGRAWTVPTVAGTRLFVRGPAELVAFELKAAG